MTALIERLIVALFLRFMPHFWLLPEIDDDDLIDQEVAA